MALIVSCQYLAADITFKQVTITIKCIVSNKYMLNTFFKQFPFRLYKFGKLIDMYQFTLKIHAMDVYYCSKRRLSGCQMVGRRYLSNQTWYFHQMEGRGWYLSNQTWYLHQMVVGVGILATRHGIVIKWWQDWYLSNQTWYLHQLGANGDREGISEPDMVSSSTGGRGYHSNQTWYVHQLGVWGGYLSNQTWYLHQLGANGDREGISATRHGIVINWRQRVSQQPDMISSSTMGEYLSSQTWYFHQLGVGVGILAIRHGIFINWGQGWVSWLPDMVSLSTGVGWVSQQPDLVSSSIGGRGWVSQ